MNIKSLRVINYPNFPEENGQLSVFESGNEIPINIKRVFTVLANKGDIRGDHAHIKCSQILVCLSGEIKLNCCDVDGREQFFFLNPLSGGILVPPMIWAVQEYRVDRSVLMVICDQIYDPEDYIRNYDNFIKKAKE